MNQVSYRITAMRLAGKSDGISCWGLKEHNFIVFEKMALSLIDALS